MNRFKRTLVLTVFLTFGFLSAACAVQSYDLKEMTPAVQQALENRKARFAELEHLKREGLIGEADTGFVEVRGDSAEAVSVTAAENQDRKIIYEAIVEQNALGPAGYAEVQKVFAEVQRGKALPGESIQLPSGEWVKK